MNVIYLTEEEFQNSKARMAETDKIDGYLKLIQPLYEAVRKFQPDALLLYCVSPSVENPCFYRLHVGLIREGITFVLHQSYKDKKCYFEVETSMFSEAKGSILHRLKEENPEPNRIGVFTKRKIEDWITWGLKIYKALEAENEVIQRMKAEYFAKLGSEPIEWKDTERHTEGKIKRNGLVFSFHICGRSIYEKFELSLPYNKSNYDTFARLADNRFTLK